jgi:hypothetical protein
MNLYLAIQSNSCLNNNFFIFLDSRAYIHDSPDLYIQKGSRLLLTCIIKESSSPPDFSYWYQNREVLNYRPQVTIDDLTKSTSNSASTPTPNGKGMDILASRLSIVELTKSHSGNYTCAPSNARPTSINVHIVDGNYWFLFKMYFK